MIPPLLLNISSSDQSVLDLCAAPGSKTFQILELLHSRQEADNPQPPVCYISSFHRLQLSRVSKACAPHLSLTCLSLQGLVVANDSQTRRCHLLVHQVKRASSSSLLVTNHDAQMFPSVRPVTQARQFLYAYPQSVKLHKPHSSFTLLCNPFIHNMFECLA